MIHCSKKLAVASICISLNCLGKQREKDVHSGHETNQQQQNSSDEINLLILRCTIIM